jgi:hypothetical protein
MNIQIKEIVNYKGHSVKTNGNVDLSFSAMYDQITKSIEVLQLLNTDVKITAKLPGAKPVMLGSFNVKNVLFDNDGESVLKFNTLTDFVEMNNINSIITQESFQLKMEANVETEDNGEEDD